MYIVCAVMFIVWTSSKVLIATATCHSLQAIGSCLSCRFMLELRSYVDDFTVHTMSVSPEHVLRQEAELRFGGMDRTSRTSFDDELDEDCTHSMFTSAPSALNL
ncbi:hypothetical protein SCHPADRAFT_573693 [Schizopora paradoxa]|uniref:Secreted protein n=1 Tax=Schizopora paradoxa TaxID=27342 RepID=A0A0H2RWR1_9AGAM|nr:hypothetical protein SCHPADRAFT_573693 [Schizopora paradoxa]